MNNTNNNETIITLKLIPQPGAKPEFLAALRYIINPTSNDNNNNLNDLWQELCRSQHGTGEVILEGYTREPWATTSLAKAASYFQLLTLESTDGRQKLPGFLQFLQQREKSSFAKWGTKGLWVVSYADNTNNNNPNRIHVRVARDATQIPNCSLVKAPAVPAAAAKTKAAPAATNADKNKKKKGGGILGQLVGAQKRTNQHMLAASAPTRAVAPKRTQSASSRGEPANPASQPNGSSETAANASAAPVSSSSEQQQPRTAAQVMNEFRQKMEQTMLDFDLSPEDVVDVNLSLSEYTVNLSEADQAQITMEIFKYMVYEAAEDVNEEWVCYKEPSEFMDECVIKVYKEGAAPPEVLEELENQGVEVPDEVRGQQQAMQQERVRQANAAEQRQARDLESLAHQSSNNKEQGGGAGAGGDVEGGDHAALGQNKRDRRTMEEYERERKRGRT